MPRFRIYASVSDQPDAIVELQEVSLCFRDRSDIEEFSGFLQKCLAQIDEYEMWDHEHFFEKESEKSNISIGFLYEQNY